MIAIDANTLLGLLDPNAPMPPDPLTGLPITHPELRVQSLLMQAQRSRRRIMIATPVLAEILVKAGRARGAIIHSIRGQSAFELAAFDERAAIECAEMDANALASGDKKMGNPEPWQKIKIDRQIIAIARSRSVSQIYSLDKGIALVAKAFGIEVFSIASVSVEPELQQQVLPLGPER